jgi:feruloyl esterase
LSLWNGCSFGGRPGHHGRAALSGDFDAIVAGAPAVNWMNLHVGRTALNRTVNKAPIPRAKYPMIHEASCWRATASTAIRDGVIENPLACRFDPKVLKVQGR